MPSDMSESRAEGGLRREGERTVVEVGKFEMVAPERMDSAGTIMGSDPILNRRVMGREQTWLPQGHAGVLG